MLLLCTWYANGGICIVAHVYACNVKVCTHLFNFFTPPVQSQIFPLIKRSSLFVLIRCSLQQLAAPRAQLHLDNIGVVWLFLSSASTRAAYLNRSEGPRWCKIKGDILGKMKSSCSVFHYLIKDHLNLFYCLRGTCWCYLFFRYTSALTSLSSLYWLFTSRNLLPNAWGTFVLSPPQLRVTAGVCSHRLGTCGAGMLQQVISNLKAERWKVKVQLGAALDILTQLDFLLEKTILYLLYCYGKVLWPV